MPGELLTDHPADGVVRLTISNPSRHGALDHPILDALAAAVREHGGEAGIAAGVRAIVLTGAGGRFSSGYDLSGLGDLAREEFVRRAEALIAHPFTAAIEALEATDVPTVAALPGHTMGGGLELALACDLRVAADHIELAMPPAKLGLVYPHTGLRRFVDAIGVARTRELFLLGHSIDPGTALAWGLINGVSDAEDLQDEVLALATDLAGGAPLSLRGNKRMLRALLAAEGDVGPALEAELVALREESFQSDDLLEGVTAFREKRPPVWRGR
ncbi:enoyl-CoA hydratase-related protein [Patulibacter sp. NPDC049589]|uniref:enoyl-CoA hydratase/isomerase family protein n=1 Tax=Patulibacter sp. NPDC049589 TaxID=3154731 RepID=UPI003414FC23